MRALELGGGDRDEQRFHSDSCDPSSERAHEPPGGDVSESRGSCQHDVRIVAVVSLCDPLVAGLLDEVANVEKMMPRSYITRDGFGITQAGRDYLAPLIVGEAYPEYRKGMPQYVTLKNEAVPRKLKKRFKI